MENPKSTLGKRSEELPPSYSASVFPQSYEHNSSQPISATAPYPMMTVSEQVSHTTSMPQAAPPYYYQPQPVLQSIHNPAYDSANYNHPVVFVSPRPQEFTRSPSPKSCTVLALIMLVTTLGTYFLLRALYD